MMFYETLFTAVVSIGIGMLMGMLFGKLMFLLLIKLIGSSEIPAFQIPSEAVVNTLVTMALVFLQFYFITWQEFILRSRLNLFTVDRLVKRSQRQRYFLQ